MKSNFPINRFVRFDYPFKIEFFLNRFQKHRKSIKLADILVDLKIDLDHLKDHLTSKAGVLLLAF